MRQFGIVETFKEKYNINDKIIFSNWDDIDVLLASNNSEGHGNPIGIQKNVLIGGFVSLDGREQYQSLTFFDRLNPFYKGFIAQPIEDILNKGFKYIQVNGLDNFDYIIPEYLRNDFSFIEPISYIYDLTLLKKNLKKFSGSVLPVIGVFLYNKENEIFSLNYPTLNYRVPFDLISKEFKKLIIIE